VRPPDGDPSGLAWLTGLLGLILPWIAVPLGGAGILMALRGSATGWWLLAGAVGLLAVDLLITLVWARRTRARSDQPLLNQRGAQYIGRRVCVVEDIAGGEGKVRVADTIWRARGPDCAAGTWVRVVAAEGSYLVVSADEASAGVDPGEQ
jgi:inner membrane protein